VILDKGTFLPRIPERVRGLPFLGMSPSPERTRRERWRPFFPAGRFHGHVKGGIPVVREVRERRITDLLKNGVHFSTFSVSSVSDFLKNIPEAEMFFL
jgi:hypothetical protein